MDQSVASSDQSICHYSPADTHVAWAVASHVFGPSTTQVDPDLPDRESRQTINWHHTEDPTSSFQYVGFVSHVISAHACPGCHLQAQAYFQKRRVVSLCLTALLNLTQSGVVSGKKMELINYTSKYQKKHFKTVLDLVFQLRIRFPAAILEGVAPFCVFKPSQEKSQNLFSKF